MTQSGRIGGGGEGTGGGGRGVGGEIGAGGDEGEEEDGWTCSSYSFTAYAGSCLFKYIVAYSSLSMSI